MCVCIRIRIGVYKSIEIASRANTKDGVSLNISFYPSIIQVHKKNNNEKLQKLCPKHTIKGCGK